MHTYTQQYTPSVPPCIRNGFTSLLLALGNVVHPVADAGLPVVGQAGGAGVAGGLTVPAGPEDGAVISVGEDAVQVGAVGGGDGGFCRVKG